MRPAERKARNSTRLNTCHPWLATRLTYVLHNLEQEGFAPRIQDAWRSPADQLVAYQRGTSKRRWGYHNCTAPDGTPASLAADVLSDDHPTNPPLEFLLRLAWHAAQHQLTSGIRWGLPQNMIVAINQAIQDPEHAPTTLKCGWDPCHLQPGDAMGITVAMAQKGIRPT